jgi:hypothetical protein
MIIQILLSLALVACVLYFHLSRLRSRSFVALSHGLPVLGLYLVWMPEHANTIAHHVGVGRGADLLLYCWVLISFVAIINMHRKQQENRAVITAIVRHLAMAQPQRE